MATVIDALVVTLGLDPSKFTAGQRAALASAKKLEEEAKKSAAGFEEQSGRLMKGFDALKSKAIGFVGVLLGATGIEQFVAKMVSGDAATSRFARGLSLGTKELAAWQQAAKTVGGSPEGIVQTFTSLNDKVNEFLSTGGPEFVALLNAISVESGKTVEPLKAVKDLGGFYKDLIVALGSMPDQARAGFFARKLGLSPADIALGQQGGDALDALVKHLIDAGVASQQSGKAMEELLSEFNQTATAAENFGRVLLTSAAPGLSALLRELRTDTWKTLASIFVPLGGFARGKRFSGAATTSEGGGQSPGGDAIPLPRPRPAAPPRIKAGAGDRSAAMDALAQLIAANVPGLDQFTSFDDALHKGRDSLHNKGRALDFTVKDRAQAEAIAAALRSKFKEMGIGGTVLDEYNFPSAGATGGHIHVSLTPGGAAAVGRSITVSGPITINTQATDATGIAADFRSALENSDKHTFAAQAEGGAQ